MSKGIHIASDFIDCQCALEVLENPSERYLPRLVDSHGFTVLSSAIHDFKPGYTSFVMLAESHVSVHTWPELGKVNVDVYTCNFSSDNTEATHRLMNSLREAFKPARENIWILERE